MTAPPTGRPAWIRLAQNLALVAGSVLVSAALAEMALRLFAPQPPSWLAIFRQHPEFAFHALLPDARAPIDTGETRWVVLTDADGFRVGGLPRAPAACTALWLGDSFAFGHGVDFEESFPALVEARTPGIAHFNAAVPGYGPTEYRHVLEELLRRGMRFDFVFVATFVGNDFHDAVWDRKVEIHEGVIGHRGDLKSILKNHLHLYRFASSVYHRLVPPVESPYKKVIDELGDPQAWNGEFLTGARAIFEQEMSRIQAIGNEHAAKVRFVILPTREAVAAAQRVAEAGSSAEPLLPVANARAVLEGFDAEFVDATEVLARPPITDVFLRFDGHLNREGNERVADGLVAAWPLTCTADQGSH